MPKREAKRRLRSAFLTNQEGGKGSDAPFRHNYLMRFPVAEQRALRLLAGLLYFKEDFEDRHFPVFRGSHNLAELRAAAEDLLSVARSLAVCAAYVDEELSERERQASRQADRFAVRAARLADEIGRAIDEIAPRKQRGS
jgi:hypothetical protein